MRSFDRNFISGVIRSDNLDAAMLVGNGLGKVSFVMEADAFADRRGYLRTQSRFTDQKNYLQSIYVS